MMETTLDIRALRKALSLTQTQLAEMAGVNLSTVWRWENDGIPTRGPARALLDRLWNEKVDISNPPASPSVGGSAGASSPHLGAPAVCQGRAEAARLAHNQEDAGSSPVPATSFQSPEVLPSGVKAGARCMDDASRAPAAFKGEGFR